MGGKYFEDFETHTKYSTPGRTITETDIQLFAGLSGDYSPIHTDEEWCKPTVFKHRIAHGLLTTSIVSGLLTRTGLLEGTGLALLGITTRYVGPVYPGDTLHVDLQVIQKKKKDVTRGRMTLQLSTINQDGKVVQTGDWDIMVACRPSP